MVALRWGFKTSKLTTSALKPLLSKMFWVYSWTQATATQSRSYYLHNWVDNEPSNLFDQLWANLYLWIWPYTILDWPWSCWVSSLMVQILWWSFNCQNNWRLAFDFKFRSVPSVYLHSRFKTMNGEWPLCPTWVVQKMVYMWSSRSQLKNKPLVGGWCVCVCSKINRN